MGTRSLTFVHDGRDSEPLLCVYNQDDGYFDGVGAKILAFLSGGIVVNGYGGAGKEFNGARDLAARLVTLFKDGDADRVGNTYIYPIDSSDCGEEYIYRIYATVGEEPVLSATAVYQGFTIEAPVSEFAWPEQDEDGNYLVRVVATAFGAAVDNSGPLTNDQRIALFAAAREALGRSLSNEDRYVFTRKALGKTGNISWRTHSPDAITHDEASRLLDFFAALSAVN